ncbi:hypothetical protein [Pseudonocardia sp. HH130629-09]|uniref:hypothetical protein n=1 Tax=Pseudonocardia sp. HH130629-09 TaxID=1641402 RepID=UPI00143B0E60|nr:hypothetical protein [Pseudonocardia sp. HH130629-09]
MPAAPPPRWSAAVLPAAAALLAAGAFALVRGALIDDAYITLAYVRTLALHGEWGVSPGLPANSATSPLNVLLQAAVTLVVRDAVVAAGIVLAGLMALLTHWSAGTAAALGLPSWTAALPAPLLLANPLLLSTGGLETYLAVVLLAGLAHAAVTGRARTAGVLCALLVLTRPDLVVVAVLAVVAVPALRRRRWAVGAAAFLVAAPWYLFSWVVLGSFVPDTLLWKVGDSWGRDHITFANGLTVYARVFPVATVLALLPAVAGVVGGLAWGAVRRRGRAAVTVLGLGAAVHAAAFVVIGTAPYHWYYGPAVGALTVLAAWSVGALARPVRRDGPAPRAVTTLSAATATLLTAVLAVLAVASAAFDIGHGTPWRLAPISTNHATAAEYARVASGLHGTVVSAGELGALAYFCDRRCTIDDPLSERAPMLTRIAARRAEAGPVASVLYDVNYLFLRPAPYERGTTRLVHRAGHHPDGVDVGTPWAGAGNLLVVPVG